MSQSIFDTNSELFNDKSNESIIKTNVKTSNSELFNYQKTLEHLFGFYECINYISDKLYHASHVKIDKNIIYLDSIASKDFFMGDGSQIKNIVYKKEKGRRIRVEEICNPFITCKYDFFSFIDWECAYIYQNYLYLIANNKQVNSPYYSHLKYFGLAIYCDNIDKFEIFKNSNYLDLRTLKFQVNRIYEDPIDELDDSEDFTEEITMFLEDRFIEKSIKCMILNSKNSHLINTFSNKEFEMEHEKFTRLIKDNNVDRKFGRYNIQFGSMNEFYDMKGFINQERRSYINEEVDGGLLPESEREELKDTNASINK